MAAPGNLCELPSTSNVTTIGSFKFRRPTYSVNYDCLDAIGLSDVDLVNTAISSPWDILKCERRISSVKECQPITSLSSSEIANSFTRKYDTDSRKDPNYYENLKEIFQRVISDDTGSKTDLQITHYILHILDEEHDKEYKIPVNASKKVLDVKIDMYACSDVKVSQQLWSGWPASCTNDDLMLSQLGLSNPVLELSFRAVPQSVPSQSAKEDSFNKSMEVDVYSSDEDEYFTELIMGDYSEASSINVDNYSFVPQDFDSEATASMQFSVSFQEKYGDLHPDFFLGTFNDALNEAFHKSVKKKLLAVYLHHNKSILTNTYCSQLLCTELVVQYLSEHFIMWGWDVTLESNKTHFFHALGSLFSTDDSGVVGRLKNTRVDKYPIIVIISGVPGRIIAVHGNVDLDELLSRLIEVVEERDKFEQMTTDSECLPVRDDQVSSVQNMELSVEKSPVAGPSRI